MFIQDIDKLSIGAKLLIKKERDRQTKKAVKQTKMQYIENRANKYRIQTKCLRSKVVEKNQE